MAEQIRTYIADGVLLPEPGINVDYSESDVQEYANRDEGGFMHKKTVRFGVRKITLKWPVLTSDEINTIKSATKGKESFTFQYYDAAKKLEGTMEAYTGDLKYTLYSLAGGEPMWINASMSFIEV